MHAHYFSEYLIKLFIGDSDFSFVIETIAFLLNFSLYTLFCYTFMCVTFCVCNLRRLIKERDFNVAKISLMTTDFIIENSSHHTRAIRA